MTAPIDSHLHVWSDGNAPFPYIIEPPSELKINCQGKDLEKLQIEAGVGGALIVQPSNFMYDHSYVLSVMNGFGHRFKGMALMNPTLETSQGISYLKDRKSEGFVGVRFNPLLWPDGECMSDQKGTALYATAGELGMPVGFMCFKGLPLHFSDIVKLLKSSPSTKAVIDHWGFFVQDTKVDDDSWEQLLSLASYPQVYIKISALFRNTLKEWPYEDLDERLLELKTAFGAERLMWGTDYPYVQQQCGYQRALSAFSEWKKCKSFSESDWRFIFRDTVESVFGTWNTESDTNRDL